MTSGRSSTCDQVTSDDTRRPGPHRRRGDPRPEPRHPLRRRAGPALSRLRRHRRPGPGRAPGCGQLLTQITGWLDRALAAGRLGHDLGEDPAAAVDGAAIFLGDARLSAAALAGDLDAAQQQLALINGRPARRTRKDQP